MAKLSEEIPFFWMALLIHSRQSNWALLQEGGILLCVWNCQQIFVAWISSQKRNKGWNLHRKQWLCWPEWNNQNGSFNIIFSILFKTYLFKQNGGKMCGSNSFHEKEKASIKWAFGWKDHNAKCLFCCFDAKQK